MALGELAAQAGDPRPAGGLTCPLTDMGGLVLVPGAAQDAVGPSAVHRDPGARLVAMPIASTQVTGSAGPLVGRLVLGVRLRLESEPDPFQYGPYGVIVESGGLGVGTVDGRGEHGGTGG